MFMTIGYGGLRVDSESENEMQLSSTRPTMANPDFTTISNSALSQLALSKDFKSAPN
jgi:hypothetical protein